MGGHGTQLGAQALENSRMPSIAERRAQVRAREAASRREMPAPSTGSLLHIDTNPNHESIRRAADVRGWGADEFVVTERQVHYSADEWQTVGTLDETPAGSQIVGDVARLPEIAPDTQVTYAVHVWLEGPGDSGQTARVGVWLNNDGWDYTARTEAP